MRLLSTRRDDRAITRRGTNYDDGCPSAIPPACRRAIRCSPGTSGVGRPVQAGYRMRRYLPLKVVTIVLVATALSAPATGLGNKSHPGVLRGLPSASVGGAVTGYRVQYAPRGRTGQPEGRNTAASQSGPSGMVPNDPYFAPGSGRNQAYLKQIGLPAAWGIGHNASSQVIAIVDSGVDATSPDLAGVVLPGRDFVGTGDGRTDPYGSGTTEAGIAAADTNNGMGIAGVAWGAKILPVRVFDSNGNATAADIAAGITWAATHGATVINLSLWSGVDDPGIHAAVENAIARGIPVVAAAGEGHNTTLPYPAADPGVISVNSDAPNGHTANFSPMGDGMDLSAPGVGILGLVSSQAPPQLNADSITTMGDGSALSAAIVSGIVALMRAHTPGLTPVQINARLRASAVDLGPVGVDPYHGYGQANAAAALGGTADPPPGAIANPDGPNNVPAHAMTIGTTLNDRIGVEGQVHWYRYDAPGGRFAVTVSPANDHQDGETIDPILDVYNSNLQQIGHEDINGTGQPETAHVIVAPGSMYIKVHNFDGSVDANPYQVTIAPDPENGSYFGDPQYYPLGAPGVAVATGDVTGDGLPDTVVATTTYGSPGSPLDHRLWVFPQQADGSLGTPATYATDLNNTAAVPPTSLAIGDFAGNGRNDVALSTPKGVEVFMQNSTGRLVDNGIIVGSDANTGLSAGDVWGDGKQELITSGSKLTVLTNGPSAWTPTVVSSSPVGAQAKVGEVDGDHLPDIVTVDHTRVHVFSRSPGGSAWMDAPTTLPYLPVDPASFVVKDLNRDGLDDIAVVAQCGCSELLMQNAGGQLVLQASPAQVSGVDLSAGDVEGNGSMDLAVCCVGTTLRVNGHYLPANSGYTRMGAPDPSTGPQAFTLADITGDGKADAIWASYKHGLGVADSNAGAAPTRALDKPWISAVTPVDGATTTTPSDPVITFGRPVAASSVTSADVWLADTSTGARVPAAVAFDSATNTASIGPLRPLTGGLPYRVIAQDLVGVDGSMMSDRFMSTLIEVGPPSLPIGLHLGNGAAGGALTTVATWSAPTYALPVTSSYLVRIQGKSRAGRYTAYRYAALTGTRFNISGLGGYLYRVEVVAKNAQGYGPLTAWSNWAYPR